MKKEARVITASVLVFLIILFGIVAVVIQQSPQVKMTRETHSANITTSQFIKKIAPAAQQEQKRYNIPASIIIAQAGTESNWGRSRLAYKYNNLFGIKATKGDAKVRMYTTEYVHGHKRYVKQYFTVYDNWAESIAAHTQLIVHGTADDHNRFKGVQTKNYRIAANELQRNGYATDPNYASELIYAIQKFNLAKYDAQ